MTFFRRYRARKARIAAQARYDAAVARGDTRSMHHALSALRAAVNECLRVGA